MDRDKVIKALNDALTAKENYPWAKAEMSFEFIEMLIELLKEDEPVAIEWKYGFPHCPVCGQMLPEGDAVKFCLHCGKKVKWDA